MFFSDLPITMDYTECTIFANLLIKNDFFVPRLFAAAHQKAIFTVVHWPITSLIASVKNNLLYGLQKHMLGQGCYFKSAN